MCVFGCGKKVNPIVLVVIHPELEILFQPLVSSFGLSVSARMVCSGYILFDAELSTKLLHELRCELQVLIGDHLCGHPKTWEDVAIVKLCHSCCIDCFTAWKEYSHFGAPLIGNGKYRVVPM